MGFLDDNYLLATSVAKDLYSQVKDLPIIDPHNHADIEEIIANKSWPNLWVVEGATDHYVWELMRKRGVSERLITGNASDKEKWQALASVFPEFAGNPTYEWIHLDLQRRFRIHDIISSETSEEIWETSKQMLEQPRMRPQNVLKEMQVEVMCTTDDPTLHLPFHERSKSEVKDTSIFPTWRPDKVMNIEKKKWRSFVEQLGKETEIDVSTLSGVLDALQKTHDYFEQMRCVASDHGVYEPYSYYVQEDRADKIHRKAYKGEDLSIEEVKDYKAYMLVQFGKMNQQTDWVTQLHIGAVRDYRQKLWESLGPDSGGDLSNQNIEIIENLRYFLNEFDGRFKIILYCVDPTHLPTLVTLARAFPNVSVGAPWWWNDSPYGMETHLQYVATVDLLSNHGGMVTDSRKLMSFGSRTEMFRRTLCNVLGDMVKMGKMPEKTALDLATAVIYQRPKAHFMK